MRNAPTGSCIRALEVVLFGVDYKSFRRCSLAGRSSLAHFLFFSCFLCVVGGDVISQLLVPTALPSPPSGQDTSPLEWFGQVILSEQQKLAPGMGSRPKGRLSIVSVQSRKPLFNSPYLLSKYRPFRTYLEGSIKLPNVLSFCTTCFFPHCRST